MRLDILGGLELRDGSGGQVPDVARQTRLILACLALAGAKGLSRADLCGLFWPDRPATQARNSLRQSLAAIRKALPGDVDAMSLQSDLEVVRLVANPSSVDVQLFRIGVEKDDRSGSIAAAHAFKGELLAGVQASADVEQFVGLHRQHLNDQAQALAERLSKREAADVEAIAAAHGLADRVLLINPASEEAHRALMRIHISRGRTNAALRQYEHCKALLRQELQAEPEAETVRLYGSIQHAVSDASDTNAAPASAPSTGQRSDPLPAEAVDIKMAQPAMPGAPIPRLSVKAARSGGAAYLGRLDHWWQMSRPVGPRHMVVAALLLLAFGGFLVPRARSISAPIAQLTMQSAPTVAVLPFKASEPSASGNAAAFGEEVRSELSRSVRYLELVIRSGAGTEAEAEHGAVRYAVSGSILGRSPDREAIVTIQLTEAETGRLVWSESVGLEAGDGPALNRIAARIARALAIQIRTAESRRPLPPRPEAGHYAMLGHAIGQDKNTAATVATALSLFQKALAINESSSSALHGLAWARLVQVQNAYIPASEHPAAIADAKSAIDRLLARDPRNAATHFLRGNMFRARKEVAEAIAAYEYTLSLHPNHQWAHASLGRMMIELGQAREAIAKIDFAIRMHPSDPLNHAVYHWAGMAALHAGDDRAAIDWLLKARLANPDYAYAMLWLAMAYCSVGEMEKAHANFAEYSAVRPSVSISSFRRNQATSNPVVAEQRERLVGLLRRLGAAEGKDAGAQK